MRDILTLLLVTDVENVNGEEPFARAQVQILLDVRNELATVEITSSQFIDVVDAAGATLESTEADARYTETWAACDEAIANAQEYVDTFQILRGRHEACIVGAGDYDPDDDEDNERVEITIDDQPASKWLDEQCNSSGNGVPFPVAHR